MERVNSASGKFAIGKINLDFFEKKKMKKKKKLYFATLGSCKI